MVLERFSIKIRQQPRLWPALTFLASGSMLATAWGFQLIGGLQPCTLCLYQRWPYWIVLAASALAILAARRLPLRGMAIFAILMALIFLTGAGIAGFHAGVEYHWWEGLAACGGGQIDPNMSIEELRKQIYAAPVVRCDDVAWSLFGISMAGWNFLASLAFAGLSTLAALTFWRKMA